jgi:alpha-ketoglutaric semialdehyde dehydrogenase
MNLKSVSAITQRFGSQLGVFNMQLTGKQWIGATQHFGTAGLLHTTNPATGETLDPAFGGGTSADVDAACTLAAAAFDPYRATSLEQRATFLEVIAEGILALGDTLVDRVLAESGLLRGRVEGERARTVGQLRFFAALVREGRFLAATFDTPLPDRTPIPCPDLRSQKIPLGPVAVFGASNFPLAFSVAGGDTATALAAGCPVVVKAHPSHLGTSELVATVIQQAVANAGLPEGVFSLLIDDAVNTVSAALVQHPAIQAVAFTGSRRVGLLLVSLAAKRAVPIPVFAEMSGINPVFLLPAALEARAETIAQALIDSVTLGTGQMCTKPGIVMGIAGPAFDRFRAAAITSLEARQPATMLTAGIQRAYAKGLDHWKGDTGVKLLASSNTAAPGVCAGQPTLFATTAAHFLASPHLLEEVFGPTTLLIECHDQDEVLAVANHLDGQLTAALHMEDADTEIARRLLPILERKAGRILVNGFPTGVEVGYAMVHGGPYPSTSESRSTSVGAMAIDRFLRPVCYQNFPAALLPEALREGNPLHLLRLVDGKIQLPE